MTLDEKKLRAESFISDHYDADIDEWDVTSEGNTFGVIPCCPFEDEHTTGGNKSEPVWVFLEPNVKVHCFHQSCLESREAMAKALWMHLERPESSGLGGSYKKKDPTPEQLAKAEEKKILQKQIQQVVAARESGLIHNMYGYIATPNNCKDLADPLRAFMDAMYNPNDLIWSGEFNGSGQWAVDAGIAEFTEAKHITNAKHPFISNSTYKSGTVDRKKDNVLEQKYIVLEWDKLLPHVPETNADIDENLRRGGALFQYVKSTLGLEHCSTVYSGNKSLHFWVKKPSDEKMRWLKNCAKELRYEDSLEGLDTACMAKSQPCRTPTHYRADKEREQKLIFLR